MAKVELKQPIVEEIKASLDGAKGVVLVDHRGLTVEQDTVLRKSLREAGVTYKVYKNTLVKRAIEGTEFRELKGSVRGSIRNCNQQERGNHTGKHYLQVC